MRAIGVGVHVGRWDTLDGFVERVYGEIGSVDVLVNNAGMSPLYDSVDSVSEELFDKVIGVNLKGPFRLSALVGTRMAAGAGGSIINISSVGAVHPRPNILPYAAAKAGLNALTEGLARTFGPSVRVNAIMAGTFLTDVSKSWDVEAFAERAKGFALERGGEPDEIVGAALYLASDLSVVHDRLDPHRRRRPAVTSEARGCRSGGSQAHDWQSSGSWRRPDDGRRWPDRSFRGGSRIRAAVIGQPSSGLGRTSGGRTRATTTRTCREVVAHRPKRLQLLDMSE